MQLQSRNSLRRRGVVLNAQGLRKLNQAKSEIEIEQNFRRYTLETLSDKTGLTSNTLSKVLIGSAKVDRQTLQCCFKAFNLTLETEDYCYLEHHRDELSEISSMPPSDLKALGKALPTTQTHKMPQRQESIQPRSPTAPTGQLPLDSSLSINRPPLESRCYEAIQQAGMLLKICAPKQMGKTSLIARILAHAKTLDYQTVSLNLQLADAETFQELDRFLQWFCARVSKQLDLPKAIALWAIALGGCSNLWDNPLGSKSNATDYLEDILFANGDRPLVLAIDELSQLFVYPDITREFLELLRVWSEQAKANDAVRNPWHNLRLVTVHSTEIQMPVAINPALLNTGLAIKLPEFTSAQVRELAQRWGQDMTAQQIENAIALLGGHPYRLQLAFYHLDRQTITLEQLLANSEITLAIYAEHLQQQWWNLQRHPKLLPSFTQIVRQSSPVECDTGQGSQLQNMGLVHLQGLQASLACELFRPFFRDRLPQISN